MSQKDIGHPFLSNDTKLLKLGLNGYDEKANVLGRFNVNNSYNTFFFGGGIEGHGKAC